MELDLDSFVAFVTPIKSNQFKLIVYLFLLPQTPNREERVISSIDLRSLIRVE